MAHHVTTPHGDTVAYDLYGTGPPLIFVAGAGPFREMDPDTTATAYLAAQQGLTTVVYDRIGRGDSTGNPPIGLDREVAALAALIDAVTGPVTLCGHSSGSTIALYAAAAGLPVAGLALWETPSYGTAAEARGWTAEFTALLEAEDHRGALEYFNKDIPPEIVASLKEAGIWDVLAANIQSQRADAEALAWFHSSPLTDLMDGVKLPILVMVGESTVDEVHHAADIITALPNASKLVVPGAHHQWDVEPMAQTLVEFVSGNQP